jgi:uncharacterized membrane protein YhiD involved in acid resistance
VPEFFLAPFASATPISPIDVAVRLLIAAVLGGVVSWVYRRSRTEFITTFPATLVLLAILIAMVTQVIGDSVARAFSLVGALSIVRFRTVVRDTQDTAFVIFAVVVGMACGASDPRVAVLGILVVSAVAFIMRPRTTGRTSSPMMFRLSVRMATGQDLNQAAGSVLDAALSSRRLVAIETAKNGIALETSYIVQLRSGQVADDLVRALNRLDGVQHVAMVSLEAEEPLA